MWITFLTQYFVGKNFLIPYLVSNIRAENKLFFTLSTIYCGISVDKRPCLVWKKVFNIKRRSGKKKFLTIISLFYIILLLMPLLGKVSTDVVFPETATISAPFWKCRSSRHMISGCTGRYETICRNRTRYGRAQLISQLFLYKEDI